LLGAPVSGHGVVPCTPAVVNYGVLCVSRFLVVCFGSGGIGLFQSSGGGLMSYHVLFRQGRRWWLPVREVVVSTVEVVR
jgi:hypothetical protein